MATRPAEQTETEVLNRPATLEGQGVPSRGMRLDTEEDILRVAKIIAESGLAPKDYKNNVPNCFVAIMMGQEVGLPAMSAIQNIAVINGRPSLWGDAMLAICMRSGQFNFAPFHESIEHSDDDGKTRAVCTVQRNGQQAPTVRVFSVSDAKKARLWGKQGPWSDYPKRMLQMRARAFALRDTFPDVLGGMYSVEELTGVEATNHLMSQIETDATLSDRIREASKKQADPDPTQPPAPTVTANTDPAPPPTDEAAEACNDLKIEIGDLGKQLGTDKADKIQKECGIGIFKRCVDMQKLTTMRDALVTALETAGAVA